MIETLFSLSSLLVLPFWLLMIVFPHWRWTQRLIASPLIAVPPVIVYAAIVLPRIGEILAAVANPTLPDRITAAIPSNALRFIVVSLVQPSSTTSLGRRSSSRSSCR